MQKDGNKTLPGNKNSDTPVKGHRTATRSSETKERLAKIYASLSNLRSKTDMSFSQDRDQAQTTDRTKSKSPNEYDSKKQRSNMDVFARLTSPQSTKSLHTPKKNILSERLDINNRRNLYSENKPRSGSSTQRSSSARKMMIDTSGTELQLSKSVINTGLTDKVENDIKERKKLISLSKLQGAQKFESKMMRKEMENQTKILENRLKKLAKEHENLQKEIEKSERLERKALNYKSLKKEELKLQEAKRMQNKLIEDEKRERVRSLKRKNIDSLKESMINNRAKISKLVSDLNYKMNEKREEMKVKGESVERSSSSRRKDIIENRKKRNLIKDTLEETRSIVAGINHSRFLEEEKKNMEHLNTKISGLIKMEEVMIDRIKNTQCVKSTIDEKIKRILLFDTDSPDKKSS